MPAAGFAYAFVQLQRSAISFAGALRAIALNLPSLKRSEEQQR
jgi:hypothetical protein